MPWNLKQWWKGLALVTLALEILCLAISPNPLSIFMIPVGIALIGGSVPVMMFGVQRALDTSQDGLGRTFGVAQALFCFGFAWGGLKLTWTAIVVALAVLGWKLD